MTFLKSFDISPCDPLTMAEIRGLTCARFLRASGCNSMVECQLPKLKVASSILVTRSTFC